MNPILMTAIVNGVVRSTRTCPRCKRSQIVSVDKKTEPVTCKSCGAAMPPPRT